MHTNRITNYLPDRTSTYYVARCPDGRIVLVKPGQPLLQQCQCLCRVKVSGHDFRLPPVLLGAVEEFPKS